MDQLNTHKSASLVKYVAEACGIKEDLGNSKSRNNCGCKKKTRFELYLANYVLKNKE